MNLREFQEAFDRPQTLADFEHQREVNAFANAWRPPTGDRMTEHDQRPGAFQLHDRVDNDFVYHTPKGDQPAKYERLRAEARALAHTIVELVPPGREQSSALTRLEEAIFHANAGIARS